MVSLNPLLSILDIKPSDRVISIKENGNIDSNFVITHVIKQALLEKNAVCLVLLHNTLGHYQAVGRRLGFDLAKKTAENHVKSIDVLRDIGEEIAAEEPSIYLSTDKHSVIKHLFDKITATVAELSSFSKVYLVVDDVSHLLDLGVDLQNALAFVNYCISLGSERIVVVMNAHVSTKGDQIIANNLQYAADLAVEVAPLKTGFSREVSGLLRIERVNGKVAQFHYKAFDKGIKTFHLGESLYNLYK